ncbi:LuxR C-terminal-related transcriptional regulator [Roseateles violae]|uniref:LuxR C-terminal-related transcriptional regulator n=1 Tax=Roseateles violae TaxID=3058042 RepID=A0ABT8DSJ3_9BURK|nr:LuxR C-terminal-related transcriptional regulator [Pelomonas sp. PFR6]MDN3921295.1 LuxR C-terminal-related transcriptional regulator [Pelomonas sp. PFR6]
MVFPLSKIRLPRLPSAALLARPGLEARLGQALAEAQLLLISAPAGFGKTALLARVLEQQPADWARVWLALEAGDELRQLVECLLAALEPYDPPWRVAPESLLDLARRPEALAELAATLTNALDACEVPHGVLALDDVQHLRDEASLRFLDLLVQHLGPRWTLVLSARQAPALRLARLRGGGLLAEFGESQLRFSASESLALLGQAGIADAAARQLHARTAGWPAGLRLALSGARSGEASIDRDAFELLSREVLDALEPGLRRFLLDCSVLQELDPPRCAAVSGNAQALHWLEAIQRQGLFAVLVDESQPLLRLHDLFRDALRHRLRLERPQDEPALLLRAAAVEPDPVRRQGLLLAAGAHSQAAAALLEAAPRLAPQRGSDALRRLCAQFPPEMAAGSAELHRILGMADWADWQNRQAEHHLAEADRLFEARGEALQAGRARAQRAVVLIALGKLEAAELLLAGLASRAPADAETQTTLALARTWLTLESCRFDEVAPAFAALVQLLERQLDLARWYSTVPPPRQTACRGIAPWLARWAEGALTVVGDQPLPLRALGLLSQAWLRLWQDDLDGARTLLARADDDAKWTGQQLITRHHGLAMRALLAALGGDSEAALALAQQRLDEQPPAYGDWGLWHNLFLAARIAACAEAGELLAERLQRLDALNATLSDLTPRRLQPLWGLRGTLAWLRGDLDLAEDCWLLGLDDASALDLYGQASEARARLALLRRRRGDEPAAAALLGELLAEAQPGGALFARAALRELADLPWDGQLDADQLRRLQAWAARPAAAAPAPAEADEGLSAREQEVLALIARGTANKLIARELDLSPHTVKRHVANILTKLGLASRGQAAAWWLAQRR